MSLLEWSADLSVGVEEIDDDHKRLVGLVNQLNDAIASQQERQVIGGVIEELIEYTIWHFRHEERLMQTYGDPSFMEHKKKHEDLTMQVQEAQQKYSDGDPKIAGDMLPFLKDWLTNHILGTDKIMGQYLAEHAE